MRKIVIVVSVMGLLIGTGLAQSPRGKAEATVGGGMVKIDYGRPSLQGRDMLGRAPEGMVWRMGADGATTLDTSTALKFGDASLPAGRYTLRARREASGWTLLISGGGQNLEVPLETGTPEEAVETFTIELRADGASGVFSMAWGSMHASASFSAH